jgi:uncharacterized RDD family membrane protein YckC
MSCARRRPLENDRTDGHLDAMTIGSASPGLPDPARDARFYEGVAQRRLIAFALDAAAIAALGFLGAAAFGIATFGVGFLAAGPVALGVAFLYRAITLARLSATPGMWIVGVELREAHGGALAPWTAMAHTALYFGCFFLVIPQIASVWLMATTPTGRGLPDLALGAAMIHRPA